MRTTRCLGPAGCLVLTLLTATAAAADLPGPTTAAVTRTLHFPTVIRRPGLYTVGSDFAVGAGETAIRVRADDVTLDLGGRTLSGPGGPGAVGVAVEGVDNVSVTNGALVGFGIGVILSEVVNARVAGLQIHGEDLGGAPPDVEIGILLVDARGVVVADNVVTNTFLGVFVRGEGSGGNRIAGNTLVGGDHGGLGICYNPAEGASAGGPSGDLVYGNLVSRFATGIALSADSRANVVRGNTLATFETAISESNAGSNELVDNVDTDLTP
jgi:hypothetical protein